MTGNWYQTNSGPLAQYVRTHVGSHANSNVLFGRPGHVDFPADTSTTYAGTLHAQSIINLWYWGLVDIHLTALAADYRLRNSSSSESTCRVVALPISFAM